MINDQWDTAKSLATSWAYTQLIFVTENKITRNKQLLLTTPASCLLSAWYRSCTCSAISLNWSRSCRHWSKSVLRMSNASHLDSSLRRTIWYCSHQKGVQTFLKTSGIEGLYGCLEATRDTTVRSHNNEVYTVQSSTWGCKGNEMESINTTWFTETVSWF